MIDEEYKRLIRKGRIHGSYHSSGMITKPTELLCQVMDVQDFKSHHQTRLIIKPFSIIAETASPTVATLSSPSSTDAESDTGAAKSRCEARLWAQHRHQDGEIAIQKG